MEMANSFENLYQLNIDIGSAESAGDANFFTACLAPAFSMRRASGKTETRDSFIQQVARSGSRNTLVLSISLLGRNRAAVNCIVELDSKRYENFRLFTRESLEANWQLLSWANESLDGR